MRPLAVSLSALGNSAWLPIDQLQTAFSIALGCTLSNGAVLTYSVQHTFDDPSDDRRHPVSIARALTVATVTDPAHNLVVGDSVVVTGSGSTALDGTYDVATVVDANTYTYTCANSGPAASGLNTYLNSFRVFNHAFLSGQTTRQDGNYAFPFCAVRLKVTAYTSGTVTMTVIQAKGR